ncbi:MAG: polysaccharide pyruvyl transferase family protein [Rhodocyclaceae bacterium]|nr:polysaccharide pyruvyl transferase family protein [Rhodocyclaceae bacterium]
MSLHIAIYGAAADISPHLARRLPLLASLKRNLKVWRDQYRLRYAANFHCDYRDYSVKYATNIGDIAIAETIRLNLRQALPDCSLSNVDWGDTAPLHALNSKRRIDLLVVAGGGYFLFNHDGGLQPRLRADLDFLKTSGIPYMLWGVGVNQPFNPQGEQCRITPSLDDKETLRSLLDGADLVTVRDVYSADYLSALTGQNVQLIGDPALHTAAALGFPPAEKQDADTTLIGINLPFHGPSSNQFLLANLAAYVRALKAIQQSSHCRFRYITHHANEYVIPRLLRTQGISMDIVHADLAGTCAAYRDLDLHIGGMLHSCILAASSGTPWIAIAYDIKHRGFNQLMGMDDYYQDTLHFSATALSELAQRALENRNALRQHIAVRREELRRHSSGIISAALEPLR